MTVITANSATPDWFRCGCYGGYSSYSGGGSTYYACGGYGCGGWGCGGWGCGGWGCGGWGCYGGWAYGGYGCAGAGYGYHGGCYGGYGNWSGDPFAFSGCYGCHGGYSGYGIPVPIPETAPAKDPPFRSPYQPMIPDNIEDKGGKQPEEINAPPEKKIVPPKVEKKDEPKKDEPKKDEAKKDDKKQAANRVKVRIDVPEGAKLFVDGNRIKVSAGPRIFQTPPLAPGQKYFYDFRLELDWNGQLLSEDRRVIIQSGADVAVTFPNLVPRGTYTVQANE
jgi:uncharacterized protein (TIGR03000 family)